MIDGIHAILYTPDADALRAFFRDVLELPSVDAAGFTTDNEAPNSEFNNPTISGSAGVERRCRRSSGNPECASGSS